MSRNNNDMKNMDILTDFFGKFGIVIVACLLIIVFSFASDKFFSIDNIFNIIKQISVVAILSIGMTVVFLIGGMDLSAGSNILLAAVITGAFITSGIVPAIPAMIISIFGCGVTGLINGLFSEKLRINSVIVTLGTQLVIRGIALIIIGRYNQWIWMNKNATLKFINVGTIGPIPVIFIVVALLYIIAYFVLTRTNFGRQVYAVGGNEKAAVLSGLKSKNIKIWCYIICGFTAGIAGIIVACRLGMVNTTVGIGMEFDAVTAVVLGGASLKGGEASVLKTLIGAIIVGLIMNFLTLYGVHANYQRAVTGAFILTAAFIDRLTSYNKV
jgi:ribose/xylose/arabinose/galactoside ABC-type transport system permease subunit